MNRPALKKINIARDVTAESLARLLLQMQGYLVDALSPLLENPRALSVTREVTFVAATPKLVNHGLQLPSGRVPSGWLVSDIDTNTTIKRTAWDDKTITLQAASDCTASIEVW